MKRALDSSLEWLILLSRVLSVVGGLAVIGLGITMAILGELLPWLGVWLQAVLWTIVFGWFGWWFYGNEEWRSRRAQDDP